MKVLQNQLRYRYHSRAAVLFVCLWALVVLGILAMGISSRVASEVYLAKYLGDNVISLSLAKAAINKMALEFEKDLTPDYDSFYELQKQRQIQLGNAIFDCSINDEGSLININTANDAIMARLPGIDEDTAKTIVAWTLKPFLLKEELLAFSGITSDNFSGFKDLITTFGGGSININTAPSEVLEVLGLESSLIDAIMSFRKGPDGEAATEDDGVFENAGSIVDTLRLYTMLSAPQEQDLLALISQNRIGVKSTSLKLNIETKISGKTAKKYQVILDRTSGKITFWKET